MSDIWTEDQVAKYRSRMDVAINVGDEREAGVHAARIVTFCNALARVQKGRSESLARDPFYGRLCNVAEYFQNPRTATSEDDLGSIDGWSI